MQLADVAAVTRLLTLGAAPAGFSKPRTHTAADTLFGVPRSLGCGETQTGKRAAIFARQTTMTFVRRSRADP
jgi:hypothetical protein